MNIVKHFRLDVVRPIALQIGLVTLLSCALPAFAQTGDPKVQASYATKTTNTTIGDVTRTGDRFRTPDLELPFDFRADIEPDTAADEKGIWIFANESGRVRVRAETGRDRLVGFGGTQLWWSQIYQKNSDLDTPKYVVNPTVLEYFFGRHASFYFGLFYECYDSRSDARKGKFRWQRPAISQQSRIGKRFGDDGYFHSRGTLNGVDVSPGPLPIDVQAIIPNGRRSDGTVRRTTETFRGEIDLDGCDVGGYYKITYVLFARARDEGAESGALAFLGDPLEVDTGFELEPAGPEDEGPPGQLCRGNLNTLRFVDNLDGTATDTETSLVWQRCPVGYTLQDGGTPDELGDDSCVPDGLSALPWKDALQLASNAVIGGQSDWRLPNIKELDSLTELSCIGPAIAPGLFPDTPIGSFWSATPDAASGLAAKVVDAHQGDIFSAAKTKPAFARLVRDSGADPLAPPVKVTVSDAMPAEEASGALLFPLRLSRAADTDVVVDYRARDRSALAGDDYVPTTGTAIVPAGALEIDVALPIVDDEIAESHEIVELELLASSANAWIATPVASGEIQDDEPRVTVRSEAQYEGASGFTTDIAFFVDLDRPARGDVILEYSARDGSATLAEGDYTATSGTVRVATGERLAVFVIRANGDATIEGDEYFDVELFEPATGNAMLLTPVVRGYIVDDEAPPMAVLNDSGVSQCTNDSLIEASCPQPGYPGQDAEYGLDAVQNDDSDGYAGMQLLKIDSTGAALADQSVEFDDTPWDCVTDEVTALMWEVKTDNDGLRDRDWRYSWYNSSGFNDGGDAGLENDGSCAGGARCDTEGYVAAVNAASLCGFNDWRMPTREELLSLDINLPGGRGIDDNYFPYARASISNFWWSGTPAVHFDFGQTEFQGDYAWSVSIFDEVNLISSPKSIALHSRLVRNLDR